MTKFLRNTLGAADPMFSHAIKTLETMTSKRGIDIAYTAEIMSRAHAAMRSLSLDPRDTTAKELYHVLDARRYDKTIFDALDDVVLYIGNECISFNISDVIANHARGYEARQHSAARESIYCELVDRYTAIHSSRAAVRDVLHYAGIDKKLIRKEEKR